MGLRNRLQLLVGYLARRTVVDGQPVEYIVETTGRCNLVCPMCPREHTRPPNREMSDAVFESFVDQARGTAESAMLIGLGEPLLDRGIFDRIERCQMGHISGVISTNGTLLDEEAALRLLDSGIDHVILSFDGATKETYEHYRKGARFEQVRENCVRFAALKHRRNFRTRITVQMILMEKTRPEIPAFLSFWRGVPGIDDVRVKEDETDVIAKEAHPGANRRAPCHYLWRGPMYLRANGDVHPCHPSATLGGAPLGNIRSDTLPELWNGATMQHMRKLHVVGRSDELDVCRRCCATIPHPLLVTGSLMLHAKVVRALIPRVERAAYLSKLPTKLLRPPRTAPRASEVD